MNWLALAIAVWGTFCLFGGGWIGYQFGYSNARIDAAFGKFGRAHEAGVRDDVTEKAKQA